MLADNGPQYSSVEFVKFADDYNFKHVTSSPYYPLNNGCAESAVQRVKQTFGKKVVTHTSHYSLFQPGRNRTDFMCIILLTIHVIFLMFLYASFFLFSMYHPYVLLACMSIHGLLHTTYSPPMHTSCWVR